MYIYLKTINADNRKIDKWTWRAGDTGTEKTVYLTDFENILSPVVSLDYDSSVITSNYNYVYIPAFKRYYYIAGLSCDDGKRIYINLTVDVLNSYKDGILSAPANVIRSQSAGVNYCKDDCLPLDPTRFILHTQPLKENVFSNQRPIRKPNYILGVNTSIT